MTHSRGLSLIELMVAVVVLAIIATLALPSLRIQTVQSDRAIAAAVLGEIAQQQEDWRRSRKAYAPRLSLLGYPADALYIDADGTMTAGASADSLYRISLAARGDGDPARCPSAPGSVAALEAGWLLMAVPQNAQANRDFTCGTMCLDSDGRRGATAPVELEDVYRKCWAAP